MLATGLRPGQVRRLALLESGAVAIDGSTLGAAIGVGYAWLMIYGLNHWWVEATVTPFLRLHMTFQSLAIGWATGLAVALATIWRTLKKFQRLPARQLLAGDDDEAAANHARGRKRAWLPAVCLVASAGVSAIGWFVEGEAQAGAFFGSGVLALVGLLLAVAQQLRQLESKTPTSLSLKGLALRNLRRNPHRTILAVGLAAAASFLIVAISAFQLQPTSTGVGGFDLLATSDLPVHFDLNDAQGRREYGFGKRLEEVWGDAHVVAMRVRDGDDASCLNLYQSTHPRILGVESALMSDSRFAFSSSRDADGNNPWTLLDADLGKDPQGRPIVPAIVDRNTAYYGLKLYRIGDRFLGRDAFDQPATFEVTAMLTNSVLQGVLIVGQQQFLRLYPEAAGSRYFLIQRGADSAGAKELASALESQLEDLGFDAVDARQRLGELLAVQNTYLSTFQSLGLLGLLLGAVGLAVVQLRNIIQRRSELALMRAQGFGPKRLGRMVLGENLTLVLSGLAVGCLAAFVAVLPHAAASQAAIPWSTLAILLGLVTLTGLVAGWQAIRAALAAPLLPSLRGE